MSRSELNLIDFFEEIKMTVANFADFKVNLTHEITEISIRYRNAIAINITKHEKIDLVIGLFTVSIELFNLVDFTMPLTSQSEYLFVRPIERYVTDYGWFLKVNILRIDFHCSNQYSQPSTPRNPFFLFIYIFSNFLSVFWGQIWIQREFFSKNSVSIFIFLFLCFKRMKSENN